MGPSVNKKKGKPKAPSKVTKSSVSLKLPKMKAKVPEVEDAEVESPAPTTPPTRRGHGGKENDPAPAPVDDVQVPDPDVRKAKAKDKSKDAKEKNKSKAPNQPSVSGSGGGATMANSTKESVRPMKRPETAKSASQQKRLPTLEVMYRRALVFHAMKKEILAPFIARLLIREHFDELLRECADEETIVQLDESIEDMDYQEANLSAVDAFGNSGEDSDGRESHREDWRRGGDGEGASISE